jgi:hypothetical protein
VLRAVSWQLTDSSSYNSRNSFIVKMHIAAGLIYTGTIFLAFGIVFAVIELFGASQGTPHAAGVMLAMVGLIGGAVLAGAGTFMKRSARSS